jgi:RNA polymerase sigma-70 factor (ECF subfamily)
MPLAPNAGSVPPSALPLRWLDSYGDSLYAYAIRRVRRPEVAEDLIQETLMAALQGWDSFAQRSSVRTWLSGILRNKIADHFRARHRDEPLQARSLEDGALFNNRGKWKVAVPRWGGDPLHLVELREFRAVLDACLSKLPGAMAHLFLSRVGDGVATAELCSELEITPDNAWTLLHRARSRLRQCLTANWFADQSGGGAKAKK